MYESVVASYFLIITAGILIFVITQLIQREEKQLADYLSISILLVWAIRFLLLFSKYTDFSLEYPILLVLDQHLFFLDSVLLWFYARSLQGKLELSFKSLIHFIPFLIGITLSVLIIIFNSPEVIIEDFNHGSEMLNKNERDLPIETILFILFIIVWSVSYLILSLKETIKFNKSLFEQISTFTSFKAEWLIHFHRLWIALFIVPSILYFFFYLIPGLNMLLLGSILIYCLMALSLFFANYSLKQSYIKPIVDDLALDQNTRVSDDALTTYKQQLFDLLEKKEVFKNEKLSLQDLSNQLNLKTSLITEIIKNTEYSNFYDLINSYRIESVKRDLIRTNEQIIILAYQNGFNSKSAFNKIFKEKTGYTPSQFRVKNKSTS